MTSYRSLTAIGMHMPLVAPLASHQRGSIAVLAAAFISLAIILAASIDIGFLFYQKRELQKVADMAALAGAQELAKTRGQSNFQCASSFTVAQNNAQLANSFSGSLDLTCGRWDPIAVATAPHYAAYAGGVTPINQPLPNAIRAQVVRSFRSFFGVWAQQQVAASAIATADTPTAVFSVGSNLLKVNGGSVTNLLSALGVNIDSSALVSYNGLANVNIETGALLKALGFDIPLNADIATIKQAVMLNTSGCSNGVCSLEALLGAISTIGGQQNLISALGMQSQQLTLPIKILSDATGRGLIGLIDTADGQSALKADLNALELLTTGIGVANSHRFVAAPLGVTIPGITNSAINTGIVEPPSIGIGGVGTTASTAQVRLATRIQANALNANLVKLDLPLQIDVVNGVGTITDMCTQRDAAGNYTATIAVTAPILSTCIGNVLPANAFTTNGACSANLQNQELLNVLNGGLKVSSSFALNALSSVGSVVLSKGQTATVGSSNLPIGTAVSNLARATLATVLGKTLAQGQGTVTNSTLAGGLLSATNNTLATAVSTLNDSLTSLKTFVTGLSPDVKALLGGSLSTGITNLLSSVGNLLTGLLTSVGNLLGHLLGNVACALSGNYDKCVLENQLNGNQTSGGNTISNVLLSILGLVEKTLEPILNSLGNEISILLNNMLGAQLGQVDVKLIDLNCGGGENVRLVF
jgi:uncharacterized membrane protein